MKLRLAAAAALLGLALSPSAYAQGAGAGTSSPGTPSASPLAQAVADLRLSDGSPAGTVLLSQWAHGVWIRGELQGLPPGWHALHVHETGACRPDFKAAGGHFNPTGAMHGLNAGGPHAGDLPNVWANEQGVAKFEMSTNRFSLTGAARVASAGQGASPVPTLFDDDGAALVIHAKPDDHVSEPSGAAGDRVACGEIARR